MRIPKLLGTYNCYLLRLAVLQVLLLLKTSSPPQRRRTDGGIDDLMAIFFTVMIFYSNNYYIQLNSLYSSRKCRILIVKEIF